MRWGFHARMIRNGAFSTGRATPTSTPCAHSNTRIGSRQELRNLPCEDTIEVHHLSRQLIFIDDPGIPDIHEGSQSHRSSNDRNSILHVENGLSIATDIHDIVERRGNHVSCFRIQLLDGSRQKGYRTQGPEVESANIEIAARKEPLVERHGSSAESSYVRRKEAHRNDILMLAYAA